MGGLSSVPGLLLVNRILEEDYCEPLSSVKGVHPPPALGNLVSWECLVFPGIGISG